MKIEANFLFRSLGLGHQQQRPQPEIADQFRKEGIYFKQLALQKFHSVGLEWSMLDKLCIGPFKLWVTFKVNVWTACHLQSVSQILAS